MKKISISFEFKGNHYDAVIRVRKNPGGRKFQITVLNWELERMLYGNQVIKEVEGVLQPCLREEEKEQTELKLSIAYGLSRYLNIPCFAGDCLLGTSNGSDRQRLQADLKQEGLYHDGAVYR